MNDRSFTARLVTLSPLHVGGGEAGFAVDLPLLRDAGGRLYIPGTQIAGRLREVATRLGPALGWAPCVGLDPLRATVQNGACTCRVCAAFGSRFEGNAGDEQPGGTASQVWCFDAVLEDGNRPGTMIRDGVGIDRRSGTANHEARALYDREWIAPGAVFGLRVELDVRADAAVEQVLAVALGEWQARRGRMGGAAARGGGAFCLRDGAEFRRADVRKPEGLLAFLGAPAGGRGPVEARWLDGLLDTLRPGAEEPVDPPVSAGAVTSFAEVSFELAFSGAMLVNDPAAALAHSLNFAPISAPVVSQADAPGGSTAGAGGPVLPGASVRGVLRSQVERIARTLSMRAAADAPAFAGSCAACDPFRGPAKAGPRDALVSCAEVRKEAEGRDPAPAVALAEDCMGCSLFGATHAGSRLWIADAPLRDRATYRLRDFVAIDRFTGGAKHGAKFDALPLYDPTFRVTLLLWQPQPWELAALAFALRDVHDGLATLGAHASKGFGRAAVADVDLRLGSVGAPAIELPAVTGTVSGELESGVFHVRRWAGDADQFVALARAGTPSWAAAFNEQCVAGHRRAVPEGAAVSDAWFGAPGVEALGMQALYPILPAPGQEPAHV